ncbi:hypothetical protein SAY87_001423 [Trapa incisa]|uniref:ENTH domain-containing protein n=1 Tax=Trapa incisa TaxID=236973 RepID=A0AAN7JHD9_9MYRT|nr:hypothetical protein SAY87_001423 [Trapa incisa]
MPSKLKKAMGVVKDRTSISLAKVGSNNKAAGLQVAILKATSHHEAPTDERYVVEVLRIVDSNRIYAATCAYFISRRVKKTRNWTVALKSLMLVLRVFQDGGPYFPREVLQVMKRGGRILNLSTFRDHSKTNNPLDYTAYVRIYALYLEERLDCFLMGKLQHRVAFRSSGGDHRGSRPSTETTIREMKPSRLLDRISCWQRLLDRAIATRPTGAAQSNRLVQFSLHAIVQESFDLYRDTSDGLSFLLDSFFHLQYQSCLNAFQICVTAAKQFKELSEYYAICKSMGVGRTSEYPSVQKISEELIETLREFLKDLSSVPNDSTSSVSPVSPNRIAGFASPTPDESQADGLSEYGSQWTSHEDLFSVTDDGSGRSTTTSTASTSPTTSNQSGSTNEEEQQSQPTGDLAFFDGWLTAARTPPQDPGPSSSGQCWELSLAELVGQAQPNAAISLHHAASTPDNLFEDGPQPPPRNNSFLDDDTAGLTGTQLIPFQSSAEAGPTIGQGQQQPSSSPWEDVFSVAPTFQAMAITTPTFNGRGPNVVGESVQDETDPFSSNNDPGALEATGDNQLENVLQQQKQQKCSCGSRTRSSRSI